MPPKRRKLSPSASSQSSNTTSAPGPGPSRYLPASSPPAPDDIGTPGPGPATQSLALAKTSSRAKFDDRVIPKLGVIVPGSGDGEGCGDECYLWTDLPMNKIGYRYSPCGPSPNPSPDPSRPFYRIIPYPFPTPPVHISWLDRSQYLRLSPDAMTATTDRGFRTGRANMSVREGTWYFEATILRGNAEAGSSKGSGGEIGNAHVRVGWGRREAGLDAPVGADAYAYGFRDVGGEYVHISRSTKSGSSGGYGTGDTVGCFIHLPKRPSSNEPEGGEGEKERERVESHRKRLSIRYKGQNYFETEEYPVQKEMDALVDRDGKYAQARAEAAIQALNGDNIGDGGGVISGPRGKKTKNVKKGKKVDKEILRPKNIMANFRELKRLSGSSIEFTINGQSTGTAFEDLYDYIPLPPAPVVPPKKGEKAGDEEEKLPDDGSLGYYPMISCFGRGKLKLNFGPTFLYPPKEGVRAMSERWDEWKEEERILDEKEEKEMTEYMIKGAEEDKERQRVEDIKAAKKASAAAAKKAAADALAFSKNGGGIKMVGSPLSGKSGRLGTGTPTPGPGPGFVPNSLSVSSRLAQESMSTNGDIPESTSASGTINGDKDESISRYGSPTPHSVQSVDTPISIESGGVKKPKQKYKGGKRKGRGKGKVSIKRDDPIRANSILSMDITAEHLDSGVADVGGNGEREGSANVEMEDQDAEGEVDEGWDDGPDAEGEMDVD